MILSFRGEATEGLFHGVHSRKGLKFPADIWAVGRRKMDMLNAAVTLGDLKVPPGNRLEALKGKYEGFHSIRVNGRYRVIFQWSGRDAKEVQIIDYH